jgi:hypothetical protein
VKVRTNRAARHLWVTDVDKAVFYLHLSDCSECERAGSRDGRLCLTGTLLAHPRDLRIRARAPRLRAFGPDVP